MYVTEGAVAHYPASAYPDMNAARAFGSGVVNIALCIDVYIYTNSFLDALTDIYWITSLPKPNLHSRDYACSYVYTV